MIFTFLGTGATNAPPLFGCECELCAEARTHSHKRRRPASALIQTDDTRLLIDAGLMDLADRYTACDFPQVLLTHFHPDHVQGLFHLRWGIGKPITVYHPPDSQGCADLYKHPGLLDFKPLRKFETFKIGTVTITPVPLIHSKVTFGYCIESRNGKIAYLTDTVGLPPKTQAFLRHWRATALVLDCTSPPAATSSGNHNDLTHALAIIATVEPRQTWLTHIGHEFDIWLKNHCHRLPANVHIACDGNIISINCI
jgi:phosphoribosyl 1,2-cyclic phosphate phosphodiesterase